MNPWTLLGLEDDADERTIKRQYAKLLKVTRPDDDPQAFQRLREAYEQALDWARNRFDEEYEDDAFDTPTTTCAHVSQTLIEPAQATRPPAAADPIIVDLANPAPDTEVLARQAARVLVEHTTAQNLQQQHQSAVEQGCDLAFQQRLLETCLDAEQPDSALLKAAAEHLRWLTPWQALRLSADREIQLTQQLLESESATLEQMLIDGQERAFLAALESLTQQPWLASLERRDQFQRWTMFFLHNHKGWTAALFDRICTLFGWDDRKGIFPEPEFIWRYLIERCEKYAYFEHWERLVASGKSDTVEEKAAMLVLNPGRKVDRLRLARLCNADVWITCERLCSTINNRYPEMLERFPEADLKAWRELQVAPMNPLVWTWFGWLLFSAFFMVPNELMKGRKDGTLIAMILLMYPFLMTGICRVFMRVWRPISLVIENADEWLSDKVLPEWLHWPASQALVMRHGIPLVLTGVVVAQQGFAALVCYSLLMLAWIFLSPYRHPQIYAPVREAVKHFLHFNKGKLLLSAAVIAGSAILTSIYPPERHDLRIPNAGRAWQASPANQLNCLSEEAIALMDKQCKHSLMPERCAKHTREEKISQCFVQQARLMDAPGKPALSDP